MPRVKQTGETDAGGKKTTVSKKKRRAVAAPVAAAGVPDAPAMANGGLAEAKTKTKTKTKKQRQHHRVKDAAVAPLPAIAKKTVPSSDVVKKKNKYKRKPGMVALREIRNLQKTTKTLIPKGPFQRLVREIYQDMYGPTLNVKNRVIPNLWKREAMDALQEGAESFLVELFALAQTQAVYAKRQRIQPGDIAMALHKNYPTYAQVIKSPVEYVGSGRPRVRAATTSDSAKV